MNHYPHHIGDFDRATRHLTRTERSIYRDLMDLYYDTELALTLDMAALCRRIIARSNEESTAVEQVLNEFFTKTEQGWYHVRCEAEIETYRANSSQKALAGRASAAAKALKMQRVINGESTNVEQPLPAVATQSNGASTNRQPGTVNRKPIKEPKGSLRGSRIPKDFDPLPEFEAEQGIDRQAELANFHDYWVAKAGAGGVKLDWQATWRTWARKADRKAAQGRVEPGWRRDARERMQSAVPSIAEKSPSAVPAHQFFDIEAKNVAAIALG